MTNLLFSQPAGELWKKLQGKKLLVLFSGGKDSLALLQYCCKYTDSMGWDVGALHVNHGIRGDEAVRDAQYCHEYASSMGIIFHLKYVQVPESEIARRRGLEYAARDFRYKAAEKVRKNFGYDYILSGHTLSDQLESFFVDILTGASIYTIGGVNEVAEYVVRPFLNVTTEMVNEFLQSEKLTPVYDSTNSDTDYIRNKVRHELMPLLGSFSQNYENSVLRLQKESLELNKWLHEKLSGLAEEYTSGSALIYRTGFDRLSLPEKKYLLGHYISKLARGGKVHVENALKLLESKDSVRIDLPERYMLEVTPQNLRIFPATDVEHFIQTKDAGIYYIDLPSKKIFFVDDYIYKKCTIRNRQPGDTYKGKKLKKLFSDKKLSLYDRDRAVVLEVDGIIEWVEYLSKSKEVYIIYNNMQ